MGMELIVVSICWTSITSYLFATNCSSPFLRNNSECVAQRATQKESQRASFCKKSSKDEQLGER